MKQETARLATLRELRALLAVQLNPLPATKTLRRWFKTLPKFKQNPTAKRGGGKVFYSVAAVEKFIKSRTSP